jgi:transcriptional regulator
MIALNKRHSACEFLKVIILKERGLTQKWLADGVGRGKKNLRTY